MVRSDPDPLIRRLGKAITGPIRLPGFTAENGAVMGHFGGPVSPGGIPSIDDEATPLPPHLRVMFIVQQMENEVVSGGGVGTPCWARWETHSAAATAELFEDWVSLPAPPPGEVWPVSHANMFYDALVQGGCGNTPLFPVEFHSSVGEAENILDNYVSIGQFDAVDDTTLQPNGFWTFAYTIRATGTQGGVSDFKFRGIVSITCTNLLILSPP
jgi:hypothetical protein